MIGDFTINYKYVNNIYKGTKHYVVEMSYTRKLGDSMKSLFDRFQRLLQVNRDLRLKDNVNNFVAEWGGKIICFMLTILTLTILTNLIY